jgi:hypothetical protein
VARAPVLIALAWLAATVGVPWTFGGRALNLGFVSAVVLSIAAAVSDWRTLNAALNRRLLAALGLGVLAFVVPALAHGFGVRLWLGVLRGCMVFAWFALLLAFGSARRDLFRRTSAGRCRPRPLSRGVPCHGDEHLRRVDGSA